MPSAFRNPKNLSEWIDLARYGKARPFSLGWGPWILGVTILSLGFVGVVLLLGKNSVFQAGHLSLGHASFNNDCAQCHTQPFATAARLLGAKHSSVPDQSCQTCHNSGLHQAASLFQPTCASCHTEHKGDIPLGRIPDSNCLDCHKDLHRNDQQVLTVSKSITGFDAKTHPEMAIHQPSSGRNLDPGTIRFNHNIHLKPEGIPTVMGVLPNGDANRTKQVLNCVDCHRQDKAGKLMEAISFEDHCQSCHPVSVRLAGTFSGEVAQSLAEAFRVKAAIHPAKGQDGSATLGELRNRLDGLMRDPKQAKFLIGPFAGTTNGIPGGGPISSDGPKSNETTQTEWIRTQLASLERQLFQPATQGFAQTTSGCLYCHTVDPKSVAPIALMPSKIPSRWNKNALFSHQGHQFIDCKDCHEASVSKKSSDILIPPIKKCMDCHHQGSNGARVNCSECHQYHPDSVPFPPGHSFPRLSKGDRHGP